VEGGTCFPSTYRKPFLNPLGRFFFEGPHKELLYFAEQEWEQNLSLQGKEHDKQILLNDLIE